MWSTELSLSRIGGVNPAKPNMNTHSTLPWTLERNASRLEIHTGPDQSIALPHRSLPDAQLIVTAVNSHAALVGALEKIIHAWDNCALSRVHSAIDEARAALAAAKGEK